MQASNAGSNPLGQEAHLVPHGDFAREYGAGDNKASTTQGKCTVNGQPKLAAKRSRRAVNSEQLQGLFEVLNAVSSNPLPSDDCL